MFGKIAGLTIFLVTGLPALWPVPAQASGPGEGIGHLILLGFFLLITAAVSCPLKWFIAALVWKQRVPLGWLFATAAGETVALVACFLASALIGGPRASYSSFLILAFLLYLPCTILINFRMMKSPSASRNCCEVLRRSAGVRLPMAWPTRPTSSMPGIIETLLKKAAGAGTNGSRVYVAAALSRACVQGEHRHSP